MPKQCSRPPSATHRHLDLSDQPSSLTLGSTLQPRTRQAAPRTLHPVHQPVPAVKDIKPAHHEDTTEKRTRDGVERVASRAAAPPAKRSRAVADEHSAPIGVVPRGNVGSSTSATVHTPQGNTNPFSPPAAPRKQNPRVAIFRSSPKTPAPMSTAKSAEPSSSPVSKIRRAFSMPQGLRSSASGKQPPTAEDVRTAIMGLTHDFGRLADAQKTDGGWTESSRIFHEMLGGRKGVSRQSIGNMTFHSDEQFTARKGELVFLKGDSSKDIRAQIHERLGPTHESVSNISLPLPVAQFDKHPELLKRRIWVRVSDESSSDITTWSFAPQHVVVFIEVEGDASFNFAYRQHDLDTRSMSKRAVFCSWLSSCQETYRAAEAGPSWSSPPRLSGHKPAAIAVPPRIDIEALPLTRLGGLCESFLNLVGTMNDLVKPVNLEGPLDPVDVRNSHGVDRGGHCRRTPRSRDRARSLGPHRGASGNAEQFGLGALWLASSPQDLDEADEYQEDFAATGVIENDQDTTEVVNKEGKADNEEHCEDEPPEENDERGVGNEDERVAEEENDSADETASVDNAEGTGPSTAPVPRQFRIPDLSLPAPHVRCLIEILNSLIDGTCEVNRKDALVRWKFDFEVLDTIADFANLKHTPSAVSLPVPRSKMTAAFKGGLTVGVLLTDLEGGNLWNAAPLRADKIRVTIKSVQTDKIYFTYIESDLPSTAYNQWWFFLMFLDVAARYKADEEGLQKVRKRAESKAAGQALARALPYKNGKLKGRPA
ncbi:hypothetical protein A1Q2_02371 [Trichosporon asahii var. asahii CBS 8904]|uniref:Uncharacterized protein n=1 Tax=Trichosporon asahii var. asahii (strain CBS 8904) TaxID=1220162 RepID=K1VV12_TRIAC|nr:hypothetical protein A1Q2_02371 [Trichosporon asahii var. asahii CBS 8904]